MREASQGGARRRPLRVRMALERFHGQLRAERDHVEREGRYSRQRVKATLSDALAASDVDNVTCFESVVNTCLDAGYRERPLTAFVYEVLADRFAARIRRRMYQSGRQVRSCDVEDLVGTTAVAVQTMLLRSRRETFNITYALLVSIADHRTIDHLRRKAPEYGWDLDNHPYQAPIGICGEAPYTANPEACLNNQQRLDLAKHLRTAILNAVNRLPELERRGLILVEVGGLGYDDVASKLGIKRTDVGNLVRRARLRRDKALMPFLRTMEGLGGHVGFTALQTDRKLRLNLLRWASEMGDGVCASCLERQGHLHTADAACSHQPGHDHTEDELGLEAAQSAL